MLFMSSAGIFLNLDEYLSYITLKYDIRNIILFASLMSLVLIPWFSFDSNYKKWGTLDVKRQSFSFLRLLLIANIVLSIYAIIYALPYAYRAFSLGAHETRLMIQDESVYPHTIFTTICVGVGYLVPLQVLLLFITLINDALGKYRLLTFIASFANIVVVMPFSGRDGFVFIPLMYLFIYAIFKKSITPKGKSFIKHGLFFAGGCLLLLFLYITIDRFIANSLRHFNSDSSFIYGTWGYFFQQPYVFDQNLQHREHFFGFSRRFPLLDIVFNTSTNYNSFYPFDTSFGTMFAEFYSVNGWGSLLFFSLAFITSFNVLIRFHIKQRNTTAILITFVIYLYYLITGLFYYRLYALNTTILFLLVLFCTFFIKDFIVIKSTSNESSSINN